MVDQGTLEAVPDGTVHENKHTQQIVETLLGQRGVPVSLTALADAVNWALEIQNNDPTNSKALQVRRADGTALLQIDASGVQVSHNGTVPLGNYFVWPGMIVDWDGAASAVPPGWAIVALGRFIYSPDTADAAGDAQVGTTGGAATHTHEHPHTHDTDLNHDHGTFESEPQSNSKGVTDDGTNQADVSALGHSHSVNPPALGTTLRTSSAPSATTTDAGSSLPPYARYYHIRKS